MHEVQEKLIAKIDGKYPYEFIEGQLCINADCLEIMDLMEDKSIDLLLTDPPYGINMDRKFFENKDSKSEAGVYIRKDWDSKSPNENLFNIQIIKTKNQIIFGANHFISKIPFNSSCWLVWDKDNGKTIYADCELAWTSFKTAVRKYVFRWQGMLQQDMKNKEVRIHPTQKPVGLFKMILNDYSKENDLILDCFAGSFTTAIASYKTGRYSICIEKDEDYYKQAIKRVKKETRQVEMF